MSWITYVICGAIILLAIFIFVKEIRKMIKGRCCESCKDCAVKDSCKAKDSNSPREKG